jgi:hypothetical protein
MSRPKLLGILLLVATVGAGLPRRALAVDVLYALQNSNVLTYDVDPNTLQATLVGSPLTLSGALEYGQIVPGAAGHFLYILTGSQYTQLSISVYATDTDGVPQRPAVQTLNTSNFSQLIIDPNGKFAYAIQTRVDGFEGTGYRVRMFTIDATTGMLTESSQVQGTYGPSLYCGPNFVEFVSHGSALLDEYVCSYPGNTFGITYNSRTVSDTGQLGPEVAFFGFESSGLNSDIVRFGQGTINDLHVNTELITSVRIFPLAVFPKKPLIDCEASMLNVCAHATSFWQDTTGEYLWLQLPDRYEIVKVDLASKRIVEVGSSLEVFGTPVFSPDDKIFYMVAYDINGLSTIKIYGFDFATGGITTGGEISVPKVLWNVYTGQRL